MICADIDMVPGLGFRDKGRDLIQVSGCVELSQCFARMGRIFC